MYYLGWRFCTNKTPPEQNRQLSLCADVSLFPLLHSRQFECFFLVKFEPTWKSIATLKFTLRL